MCPKFPQHICSFLDLSKKSLLHIIFQQMRSRCNCTRKWWFGTPHIFFCTCIFTFSHDRPIVCVYASEAESAKFFWWFTTSRASRIKKRFLITPEHSLWGTTLNSLCRPISITLVFRILFFALLSGNFRPSNVKITRTTINFITKKKKSMKVRFNTDPLEKVSSKHSFGRLSPSSAK